MNPNEEKLIDSLKYHVMDHNPTLQPHPIFENRFQVTYFYVRNHADLLLTVRALLYISKRFLDPEDDIEKESERVENVYLHQVISVANRLMPQGDEALMDHVNRYYREEDLT